MATPKQYWNALKTGRNQVSLSMGTHFPTTPTQMRAVSNADLAAIVVLIKALTDNGIITDAQLQAAQALVMAEVWDVEEPLP